LRSSKRTTPRSCATAYATVSCARKTGGPVRGGHYRLPSLRYNLREFDPVASEGEIHLGPGWHLLTHGALFDVAGTCYRHNAAHNAGVIYHEYGHHVSRHTADFRANALAPAELQSNLKTALDEGYCDYWTATMLDVPHIWVWHRSHLVDPPHARSLTSTRTAADFDMRVARIRTRTARSGRPRSGTCAGA